MAAAYAPAMVWECPQFVRVDGTWVLIISPIPSHDPQSSGRVAWLAGDLRAGRGTRTVAEVPVAAGRAARAYVDGSVIEIFIEGAPNCTMCSYPGPAESWDAAAAADAELTVWELGLPAS